MTHEKCQKYQLIFYSLDLGFTLFFDWTFFSYKLKKAPPICHLSYKGLLQIPLGMILCLGFGREKQSCSDSQSVNGITARKNSVLHDVYNM